MRVLAHRPVQKQYLATPPFQFFQQHHLTHIVACQSVGIGDQHPIHLRRPDRISQTVQARSVRLAPL